MLKKILNIAVPNGIENELFQLVKVALSSIVALFGTYLIAANGVAQSIWSLAALMGAMSTVISTIGIRLLLSVVFGIMLDMGVIGIAFAMCADWLFKAVLF